jgi:acetolactate synthase small subunit
LQIPGEHDESFARELRRAGGRVLASDPSSYIVELAATELEISEFIAGIGAYGKIIEVVRSGVLGIARSSPRLHT